MSEGQLDSRNYIRAHQFLFTADTLGGVGRAGLTACAWAIKMGYVAPHPSLGIVEEAAFSRSLGSSVSPKPASSPVSTSSKDNSKTQSQSSSKSNARSEPSPLTSTGSQNTQVAGRNTTPIPAELEHQIVMSIVERVIAMIRSRRGLKAIESFEQVQFLVSYTAWLRRVTRG
jgi:hypothetical protein